jgi:DNA-binding PadR family transcriptional regulator
MKVESIKKFLRPLTYGDRDFTKAEKEILNCLLDLHDYVLASKIECSSVKESGKVKILKRLTKAGFIESMNLKEGHPGRKAMGYCLAEKTRNKLKSEREYKKMRIKSLEKMRKIAAAKGLDEQKKETEEMLNDLSADIDDISPLLRGIVTDF